MVRDKCAAVIGSNNFMTLLSDGSQARNDKIQIKLNLQKRSMPVFEAL